MAGSHEVRGSIPLSSTINNSLPAMAGFFIAISPQESNPAGFDSHIKKARIECGLS